MQFAENKYTTWYFNIIFKAADIKIKGKTEHHHILPQSLFPEYKSLTKHNWNGVHLTAREHFICHWLLTKMVTSKKHKYQTWNAFSCMLYRENNNQERYKVSSRMFQKLHEQISKQKSIRFSGKDNPMYGGHSEASKLKMSKSQTLRWQEHSASEETREKLRTCHKHTGPNYKLRGKNNANHKPGVPEKREQTFMEKYGVDNPAKIKKECPHCKDLVAISWFKRHVAQCYNMESI